MNDNPYTHNFYKQASPDSRLRHSGLWDIPAAALPLGTSALGAYRAKDPVNERTGYSSGWRGAGRGWLGRLVGGAAGGALGVGAGMLYRDGLGQEDVLKELGLAGSILGGAFGSRVATLDLDPVERLEQQQERKAMLAAIDEMDANQAESDDTLVQQLNATA